MQLVKFTYKEEVLLGFRLTDKMYCCREIHPQLPGDPAIMQAQWKRYLPLARLMYTALEKGELRRELHALKETEITNLEPITILEKA